MTLCIYTINKKYQDVSLGHFRWCVCNKLAKICIFNKVLKFNNGFYLMMDFFIQTSSQLNGPLTSQWETRTLSKDSSTWFLLMIRFSSSQVCSIALARCSYSMSRNSTPGKTSLTRASNRLLSTNVSFDRVLMRRACTTRFASVVLSITSRKKKVSLSQP